MNARLGLFLSVCFVFLIVGQPTQAFFGGPDFSKLSPEKAAKAIKKMDSQIQSVDLQDRGASGLTPVIVFRANPSPNELLMESGELMDIAREITEAKGSESFAGILFQLTIPMVDQFNNKFDVPGLQLYWSMGTLKKINWSGFPNWKFLNIADGMQLQQQGVAVLRRYCEGQDGYSAVFCGNAQKMHGIPQKIVHADK